MSRPRSHAEIAAARLARSGRFSIGVALLGTLALIGLFADLLASTAPLVARDAGGGWVLLPELFVRDAADRASLEPVVEAPVAHGAEASSGPPLSPPSQSHPLGTDARGRDVLARVAFGARTALGPALLAISLGLVLGVVLGGAAGLRGGLWGRLLERLVQTVDTFPAILVVAIARAVERDPSALSLVLGVAVVRWAEVARLVRAEVLRERSEEYVMAARALGASPARVFLRHLLRNASAPVVVSSVFGVASVVLLESALSFLSLGAPVRQASWGETLAQAARHDLPLHLLLPPGLALGATIGGSYLIADAVRDALDPRTARTTTPSLALRRAVSPVTLSDRPGPP